ncbi:MAG: short-chain dehydrogenase/reductase [Myxococcaceae bacterium]|nr:short-chain dehydrogenase/reductase [Myxococcaceae bacterium]
MHVYITGASSGIGEALVREYARRGASITMVARRRALLEKIADEVGGKMRVVEADLTDMDKVLEPIAGAVEALGPIDVLINNAGVQIVGSTVKTDWAKAEMLLRLNVFTPLRLTHHVLPAMIARGKGCIVDISSMAALGPTPGMFFYNASKGALAAASEGLRGELRGTGVHVVTVYPGPVASPMETAARDAYEPTASAKYAPMGRPDVLARLIADAVEKKRPRVIYPGIYGLARHFPNMTRWLLDRLTPPIRALPPG